MPKLEKKRHFTKMFSKKNVKHLLRKIGENITSPFLWQKFLSSKPESTVLCSPHPWKERC
jgi:hypothetical protein